MDNLDQKVYSKELIEFTAVANEYCSFVESSAPYNGVQILTFMQRLLPLLYSKALSLPEFESIIDEGQEKIVKEDDWQAVHDNIIVKLGEVNDYMEAADDDLEYGEELLSSSISENLADIYQDLKDFLVAYSIGTVELMNQAIWTCLDSFNHYWGQKLVNSLRAIHIALKSPDKIGPLQEGKASDNDDIDTSDWIISKRQSQEREERDEEI